MNSKSHIYVSISSLNCPVYAYPLLIQNTKLAKQLSVLFKNVLIGFLLWVKDPALTLQWLGSLLCGGVIPGPGTSKCCGQAKKKKKKSPYHKD